MNVGYSQQTHVVVLSSNQPSHLNANAGDDLVLSSGTNAQLGGSPVVTGGTSPYTYDWTPNTELSDAAIANPSFTTLTDSRVYTLTITDFNNCTAVDEINVTLNPLSLAMGDEIRIYPTISERYFSIESKYVVEELILFDGLGRKVLSTHINESYFQLNVASLEGGVHLIKIKSKFGWSTFKIVIK